MKCVMEEVTSWGNTGVESAIFNVVAIKCSEQPEGSVDKDRMMRSAHSNLSPEDQWNFISPREKKGGSRNGQVMCKGTWGSWGTR